MLTLKQTAMLLQDALILATEKTPDKDVLIFADKRITYRQLLASAGSVACWLLETGVKPGFRGALLTDDPFEYVASYFGIMMAGGVVVGLNTQTSGKALAYTLQDSGAATLIAHKKYSRHINGVIAGIKSLVALAVTNGELILSGTASCKTADLTQLLKNEAKPGLNNRLPYRSPCDPAQIIYTSGTTGQPKGVVLRHTNLIANSRSIISYLKLTDKDRVMAVLPFFYSYGNSLLLTHILVGGSLVVNQSFLYPNVILKQMVEFKATGFSGVPSTYALLLNRSAINNFRFPDLRYITQAGAAMSPSLALRLGKVFPGVCIYIMYGQTEASARLAFLEPDKLQQKPDAIGKAIPGVQLRLLDAEGKLVSPGETGEIVARGDNIMAGYWQRPEETAAVLKKEGLWTGDLARQDSDGFFYIVSRKSDIIKCGSHRIGPKEIEDVLADHPAVHEVAVVGVPDEILDERICACVVLKIDAECSAKDLVRHCRLDLPAYKVPQQFVFLDNLPKTATGKIKKSELKRHKMIGTSSPGTTNLG